MRIKLQNIGIIQEADINVDGITLIAGQNDSGKSTVGKILYAIVKGFNQNEINFQEEKNITISTRYQDILKELKKNLKEDILGFQTKQIDDVWIKKIKKRVVSELISEEVKNSILQKIDYLKFLVNKEFNTKQQKSEEISKWFYSEFSNLRNIYSSKAEKTTILIEDLFDQTSIEEIHRDIDNDFYYLAIDKNIETYYKEAFYIESPLVIDDSLKRFIGNDSLPIYSRSRQEELSKSLSNSLKNDSSQYFQIYSDISKIINGEITVDLLEGVRYKKNNKEINIKNTAVGIKSFGLLQLLLKNNRLNNRTLLIIDEPEVHLHPSWQVKYAEILVKLSKEFSIPMVLTSHSPYFIEALEAFSKKYKYEGSTNFYYAEKNEDGLSSKITDVTKNISPILSSISEAFYTLQDINDED